MIKNISNNPCIRCGKQRITKSSSAEIINGSVITSSFTVCPDAGCQKLVEKQIENENTQRERMINANRYRPHQGGRKKKSNS